MTRKTYCGNLLWQSGLTLLVPGTGTQEEGGLSYVRLVDDVRRICAGLNVVALDNVELSPALDPSGRSTALACKFLREELLALRA